MRAISSSLFLVALSPLSPLGAQTHELTTLDFPGATSTELFGINATEDLVGSFLDSAGLEHGLVGSAGSLSALMFPGSTNTQLLGINDVGLLIGKHYPGSAGPFSYLAGSFTTLPHPGLSGQYESVNNNGLMVGFWAPFEVAVHGLLHDGTTTSTVDLQGATGTWWGDANDAGQLVGWTATVPSPTVHGIRRDPGTQQITIFDRPGSFSTYLTGINNAGHIVGYSLDGPLADPVPFLFDGQSWTTLSIPGTTGGAWAQDINDAGVICGSYEGNHLGQVGRHGFVARPSNTVAAYCAGLPNSTGVGARLQLQGSTSVAANEVLFVADQCPPGTNGLLFYSASQTQAPFGDGLLCIAAPFYRLAVAQSDPGGFAFHTLDITAPPQAMGQISVGSVWNFQYYYRDPGFGSWQFNLTNALQLVFTF